jgi:hypothetical protein
MSFRVALGEKFSKKFDYPISDLDPEDVAILQSLEGPPALNQFLTYDSLSKTLEFTIHREKQSLITLNNAYSLNITLND